jgi:uncharacterized protein (TIGR00369 family)
MAGLKEYLDGWRSGSLEPPVAALIGIKLLGAGEGTAALELGAGERHHNPMGTVHGGILCDLADAAMGVAMASSLNDGETFHTVELQINYFRSIREGVLRAAGRMVRRGRATAYVECEIVDENGTLVAKASSCCLIRAST